MSNKPGTPAPQSGIYWCSVCKLPVQFKQGENLQPARTFADVVPGSS